MSRHLIVALSFKIGKWHFLRQVLKHRTEKYGKNEQALRGNNMYCMMKMG